MPNVQDGSRTDLVASGNRSCCRLVRAPVPDRLNLSFGQNRAVCLTEAAGVQSPGANGAGCSGRNAKGLRKSRNRRGVAFGLERKDLCNLRVGKPAKPFVEAAPRVFGLRQPSKVAGSIVERVSVDVVNNHVCTSRQAVESRGHKTVDKEANRVVASVAYPGRDGLAKKSHLAIRRNLNGHSFPNGLSFHSASIRVTAHVW